jgi:PAS domain S-box-containing protein
MGPVSSSLLVAWSVAAAALAAAVWLWSAGRRLKAEHARIRRSAASAELTLTRMQQAIASAADAIGLGDMDGNSIYHNPAHVALFGYSVAELNAIEQQGILFADPQIAQAIYRAIWAGQSWEGETDVLTRDGRRVPCRVHCDVIRDEVGRAVGIFGVFTNVTERRRAEQALQEQHHRLEVTLQSIADAVITTDEAGRVVLMNPIAEAYTGMTGAEAAGQPVGEVLRLRNAATREPCESAVMALLRGSQPGPAVDLCLPLASGGDRLISENAALIRSATGAPAGAVLVVRDISRDRRQSLEAARASRLESLGLLAGGIAHDFGNLLQAMVANLTLAQMVPGLPEAAVTRLAGVEGAIWRARDLTVQLTTFAKGGKVAKQRVALPRFLREATDYAVANTAVTAHYAFAPDLAEIEADQGQLMQVFNNLAVNAVQAMPAGGALRVSAANCPPAGGAGAPGEEEVWVRITIADTGSGIAPEHLERIFDPFFTTKEQGTGFGLSTAYSVVKQHGGRIRVESERGAGTTFEILLPARSAEVRGRAGPQPAKAVSSPA